MKKTKRTSAIIATLAGIFALRTLKLAYQRSRFGHMIENVLGGSDQTVKLNQDLADSLPKTSLSFRGKPADPINLMILGSTSHIEGAFNRAGWQQAVPVSASNWFKAFWSGLLNQRYADGPMTPFYIATTPNDLQFQKESPSQGFRQRHHIRLWQTNMRLVGGTEIWLATASFDKSLRFYRGLGMPYHHIDPDLDAERDFITSELVAAGGKERARFAMTDKLDGRNVFHDKYFTDGKIVVVDVEQAAA
ncbi:MAG TPA: LssY C-terminal domain-containing protein [Candidatus Saccharimonadales bacterium]|nr:LssY C-terminal domain-containing protein [Candidatus Saccharimonadales bacterium]